MIKFEYSVTERPVKPNVLAAPPRELSDLAATLTSKQALRIPCDGRSDTEVLRIQAKLNGLARRYHTPFSVATERAREDGDLVLYAWAIPPRPPRKPRT